VKLVTEIVKFRVRENLDKKLFKETAKQKKWSDQRNMI